MTVRYVCGACTAIILTFGLTAIGPTNAQGLLPPDQSGEITIAGCLRAGRYHGDEDGYVLASPRLSPIGAVPQSTCTAVIDDRAVQLDHSLKRGINDGMLGHWIEVTGRLEKETSNDPDNLRELYVSSFRMVPVIPWLRR